MEQVKEDVITLGETFDHYSKQQAADPYPLYRMLQQRCPVAHAEAYGGFYVVSTYPQVKEVASDFRTFSSEEGTGIPKLEFPLLPIDLDPPEQTKFRKLLNPIFTVEAVAQFADKIQTLVDETIDGFIERGSAELAGELFRPFLSLMVLPLLGVPVGDKAKVAELVNYMVRERAADPEGVVEKTMQLAEYLNALVDKHRANPEPDTITTKLIQAEEDGFVLSNDQIVSTQVLILFGGLDTTSAVMAEALRYLANNPDATERLRSGELDWQTAIEEWIRWTSPVQGQARTAAKDIDLSGVHIPKGGKVFALYAAANRDPSRFNDPDRCILNRDIAEHMAFGAGAHICLGRNLARLELEILLKTVINRLAGYRIAEGFVPDFAVGESRGMTALPVVFTPGGRVNP